MTKISCNKIFDELKNKNGIFEAKTHLEKDILEDLSVQCQKECGWESPVITRERLNDDVKTYIYIEDGYVKGYAAFSIGTYIDNETGEQLSTRCIGELYTCPKYRGNGISSKLIDYGIKKLEIDVNNLCVVHPVMPVARNIILKRAGEKMMLIIEEQAVRGPKKAVENSEPWNDITFRIM